MTDDIEVPDLSPGPLDLGLARSNAIAETRIALRVPNPAAIRALQVTDVHFFQANPALDRQTEDDLKRLVDLARPDIVWMTGDLWHNNPKGQGDGWMRAGIERIAALGVPWLFVWGNHDRLDDYAAGHDAFACAPRSLYRGGGSGGHYTVTIEDAAGGAAAELVCLNSGGQGLVDESRAWIDARAAERRAAGAVAPVFAIMHIPLPQYDEVWRNGAAGGMKNEKVCPELEDGSAFGKLKALGGLRACFCGHDHCNDYAGALDGVDLVYGRATGHAGYGGDLVPKGGKLIVIDAPRGAYTCETLTPDGARWRPTPGVQCEDAYNPPWA